MQETRKITHKCEKYDKIKKILKNNKTKKYYDQRWNRTL